MSNVFGKHDPNTLEQFKAVEETAVKAALMADGHFGYIMPVGGVAAYDNMVSVHGVGYDIACGNCAIKTDMHTSIFGKAGDKRHFMLERVANKIQQAISFGVGRTNHADDAPTDHSLFESDSWLRLRERAGHGEMRRLKEKAQEQLGTVGSGNHYVDVFEDEDGFIWVGVHFGSRGLGHGIATGFMNAAVNGDWHEKAPEKAVLLDLRSSMGQDYWELMELAGQYAYAGREWVTRKVVEILGAKEVEMVHNHHNFAWKENHIVSNVFPDGEEHYDLIESERELIVVRKGATPAFPGQKGFVGGSMGDMSVILEGVKHPDSMIGKIAKQERALFSTVHGAGRVMSRTAAAGKFKRRKKVNDAGKTIRWLEMVKPGAVTKEMMEEWLKKENVILKGGGLDESPHAYRRLPEVLKDQGDTIKILHTLKPLIVVMAGADEFDPYKD
jgi:tRNA-splicing ligase RtcB (3'-phosphate/5'-hydroxy nucleic acid ligase)